VAGSPLETAKVCIAWVLAQRKRANLVPILGTRTAAQLADNLAALDMALPAELLARLDEASAIKLGFPGAFLADDEVVHLIFGTTRDLITN
jgi:diketogulonate reductase-like aldo/keto reductase